MKNPRPHQPTRASPSPAATVLWLGGCSGRWVSEGRLIGAGNFDLWFSRLILFPGKHGVILAICKIAAVVVSLNISQVFFRIRRGTQLAPWATCLVLAQAGAFLRSPGIDVPVFPSQLQTDLILTVSTCNPLNILL